MSLEQIKREFPFVSRMLPQNYSSGSIYRLWPGGTIDIKVSRLSSDSLWLPTGTSGKRLRLKGIEINRSFFVLDAKGGYVYPSGYKEGSFANKRCVGDVLLDLFWSSEGKLLTEEALYIVYFVDRYAGKFRYRAGAAKRVFDVQRCEVTIYKMPKGKTLWQLLKKYRRETKPISR